MVCGNSPETFPEDAAGKKNWYQLAFEQSCDAIMFSDAEGFQDCNPAALKLFRVPDLATFLTVHPGDLSPRFQPDGRLSRVAAADFINKALRQGQAIFEWRHRTWDGVDFSAEVLLNRIDIDDGVMLQGLVRTVLELGYTELDADGKPLRMSGTVQDITAQHRLEDELRKEKTLSDAILAGLQGIFYIFDEQGTLVRWNDRMEAVTGRSPEELDGMDGQALVPEEEKDRFAEAIAKTFSEGSTLIESRLCTAEGDIPYLLNGLRIELNDQSYLLGVGLDIVRQKQMEVALEREAITDPLTGLYNRKRFNTEMERALAHHARYDAEIALIMIDVDHFKKVNDTFGHDAGDWVLVELSKRLAGEMRGPDFLARWGGEEFVVLLPETDPSKAARVAERLLRRIEAESFPEKVGVLTISLGITSFQSGDTSNTLLKRVDAALYEAKRGGRNRVVVNSKNPGISQQSDRTDAEWPQHQLRQRTR